MTAAVFDFEARPHPIGGTLAQWMASRPGADQRAGVALPVRNSMSAISSDREAMLALFQPLTSSSGYAVTDHTAMLVSTVYACLSKIAGAVLQLPLHQYRRMTGGERERIEPASRLWWMLNEAPVPDGRWTAAAWKEWIVRCVHLRGDQVTEILRAENRRDSGAVIGLKPHHPDNVRVCVRTDGTVRYDFQDPETGAAYGREAADVLHFTGFGFDGLRSPSCVQQAARNAIGNALASAEFAGRTVGDGALPRIALKVTAGMNKDQVRDLRDAFASTYTGPTGSKLPLVLTNGTDVRELSIKPVDLELLASRQLEREHICEAMGVPPILIGHSDGGTTWGTGIEQILIGFVRFTLKPHLARWEEELNRKLFRTSGQFVEFDLDGLLRGDSKAQAEAFRAALGGPGSGDAWMTVNEVRALMNRKPDPAPEANELFRAQRGKQPTGTGATA